MTNYSLVFREDLDYVLVHLIIPLTAVLHSPRWAGVAALALQAVCADQLLIKGQRIIFVNRIGLGLRAGFNPVPLSNSYVTAGRILSLTEPRSPPVEN